MEQRLPRLKVEIELNSSDFQTQWQRCTMVANYLADFSAYEYPHREMAENLISTVLNELIETAARLSLERTPVDLAVRAEDGQLVVVLSHSCRPELVNPYREFTARLTQSQPEVLYFQLLEAESHPKLTFNQLGLAMIVHDFDVWITVDDLGGDTLRTTIALPTKELCA